MIETREPFTIVRVYYNVGIMEVWQEILEDEDRGARRLVAEYRDRLMAVAAFLSPVPSETEDVVFQTFVKAIRHIREHRPESSFYGWLYTILLNHCRSMGRKVAKSPLVLVSEVPEKEDDRKTPLEAMIQQSDAASLRTAIAELPICMREVVVMRYFEEMPLAEIAAIAEIPVGTVKSRLHEAKKALGNILKSHWMEKEDKNEPDR